jgi:FlaA1/EpsC-like NDP-sugar epimerase
MSNGAWGLYGQLWRHASLYEARQLVLSGATATVILLMYEYGPRNVPLSVVFSGCILGTFFMALLRFQSRLFSYRRAAQDHGLRVVVIGAGDAGASLVGDMLRSPRPASRPLPCSTTNGSITAGRSWASGCTAASTICRRSWRTREPTSPCSR